jgi:hypothetical protein
MTLVYGTACEDPKGRMRARECGTHGCVCAEATSAASAAAGAWRAVQPGRAGRHARRCPSDGQRLSPGAGYAAFEAPDPGFWVPRGYAVVHANVRGMWNSEGNATWLSPQDAEDYFDLIEHAVRGRLVAATRCPGTRAPRLPGLRPHRLRKPRPASAVNGRAVRRLPRGSSGGTFVS